VGAIRFPVEAGHIMMFARSLGHPDPTDGDPAIAPPTFTRALSHFDPEAPRPRPGQPWRGSGREPAGAPAADGPPRLHAEQHYEYHRPVRAGDVLSAEVAPGRDWQRRNRAGALMRFTETITRFLDADGAPVVTARTVSVVIEK
jgi:hypothetical protein